MVKHCFFLNLGLIKLEMKKAIYLFLIIFSVYNCEEESANQSEEQACDNGTYVGAVVLTTQQEVDNFGSMCYTKIDGSLYWS